MKKLEIDKLFSHVKGKFDELTDKRADNKSYPLGDALQCGLAMYSLKDSTLAEFNKRFPDVEGNMLRIYKINNCPSDTRLREILDDVSPIQIERVKRDLICKIKQAGLLKTYEYFPGWKLLLVDGVHHFSSKNIHCEKCQKRHHEDGTITYSHSMLCSVIAHPDKKEVISLCEEPIVHQDGVTKNDCELNAARRLIDKIQTRHLDEKFIFVEDALFANGPHIRLIEEKGNRYIIRVKPGSGAGSVIKQYENLKKSLPKAEKPNRLAPFKRPEVPVVLKEEIGEEDGIIKVWHYVNGLYLNEVNPDIKVNFLHYEERSPETGAVVKTFEWITNIALSQYSIRKVTKAGRCRWMIENETFNTLKNQGYHFEHNFGHGFNNLCTNFAFLMMMAFLIDQIQQLCNPLFQEVLKKVKTKKRLWYKVRCYFETLPFKSMEMIYNAIIYGVKIEFLVIQQDSG